MNSKNNYYGYTTNESNFNNSKNSSKTSSYNNNTTSKSSYEFNLTNYVKLLSMNYTNTLNNQILISNINNSKYKLSNKNKDKIKNQSKKDFTRSWRLIETTNYNNYIKELQSIIKNKNDLYSLLILSNQSILTDINTRMNNKFYVPTLDNICSQINLNFRIVNDLTDKLYISFDDNIFKLEYILKYKITNSNNNSDLIYDIKIKIIADFNKNKIKINSEINWKDKTTKKFMNNISNYINISDKFNDRYYEFIKNSMFMYINSLTDNDESLNCPLQMFKFINSEYETLEILNNTNNYNKIINKLKKIIKNNNYCFLKNT